MPTPRPTARNPDWSPERIGPGDRRLGERRLQLVEVATERRTRGERRQPGSRRESVSEHIRNAIQVLQSALVVAEREGRDIPRGTLLAVLARIQSALHEADRLARDREHLGQLLRVSERGLPPDTLPGLRDWLR